MTIDNNIVRARALVVTAKGASWQSGFLDRQTQLFAYHLYVGGRRLKALATPRDYVDVEEVTNEDDDL